jgi:hypothetical protein
MLDCFGLCYGRYISGLLVLWDYDAYDTCRRIVLSRIFMQGEIRSR